MRLSVQNFCGKIVMAVCGLNPPNLTSTKKYLLIIRGFQWPSCNRSLPDLHYSRKEFARWTNDTHAYVTTSSPFTQFVIFFVASIIPLGILISQKNLKDRFSPYQAESDVSCRIIIWYQYPYSRKMCSCPCYVSDKNICCKPLYIVCLYLRCICYKQVWWTTSIYVFVCLSDYYPQCC